MILNVLIVEDNAALCSLLNDEIPELVNDLNHQAEPPSVKIANSLNAVKDICSKMWAPHLAIVDHRLKEGQNGVEVALWLFQMYPDIHILANSAYGVETKDGRKVYSLYQDIANKHPGRLYYHDKFSPDNHGATTSYLRENIRWTLQKIMRIDSPELQLLIKYVPTKSSKMHNFLEELSAFISSDDVRTVLLTGEIGAGKSFLANVIHHVRSSLGKTNGQFQPVNVARHQERLASEIFGHLKGAYTSAGQTRAGAIKQAKDGTILLDEIGKLSSSLQQTLLELLNDYAFYPDGAAGDPSHRSTTKAFFVLATNEDLTEKVRAGDFLPELYDRISTPQIRVPSLNERKEDIILLAESVVSNSKNAKELGIKIGISAKDALMNRDFPAGGVRLLRKIIETSISIAAQRKVKQITPQILFDADTAIPISVSPREDSLSEKIEHHLESAKMDHVERMLVLKKSPKEIGLFVATSKNIDNPTQQVATYWGNIANGKTLDHFGQKVSEKRWPNFLHKIKSSNNRKVLANVERYFPKWVLEGINCPELIKEKAIERIKKEAPK